jgi:hypothetical protein
MHGRARFFWPEKPAPVPSGLLFARLIQASPSLAKVSAPLDGFCPEPKAEYWIVFNSHGCLLFLRLIDIDWLEVTGDRVRLHVGLKTYMLDESYRTVVSKLPLCHARRLRRRIEVLTDRSVSRAVPVPIRHISRDTENRGGTSVGAHVLAFTHEGSILRKIRPWRQTLGGRFGSRRIFSLKRSS